MHPFTRRLVSFTVLLIAGMISACNCCRVLPTRLPSAPPPADQFVKHKVEVPFNGQWEVYQAGAAATSARGTLSAWPILLLHDVRGLTHRPLHYALRLAGEDAADNGFVVYMPVMFGSYGGGRINADSGWECRSPDGYGPVAKDIDVIIDWVAARHPGGGLVVIGNCLSGPAAIESLAHPRVAGAVVCQPALPFPSLRPGSGTRSALALSSETLAAAAGRAKDLGGVRLLGFQYRYDFVSPAARFERLHDGFGTAFHGHQLTWCAGQVPAHFTHVRACWSRGHATLLNRAHPRSGSVEARIEEIVLQWLHDLNDGGS